MKAIGGYFGLELHKGEEYHANASFRLNTGRNALHLLLAGSSYTKIHLPYYTCDAVLQAVQKAGIPSEFYSIGETFEPLFNFNNLKNTEAFIYTNYFGLKDNYIETLKDKCETLIVDNAQAFYALPFENVNTFYSARKFFGVPDGAYLYTTKKISTDLQKDYSIDRFEHLLKRLDDDAEPGYADFKKNEEILENAPALEMSGLTKAMLSSINYADVARIRRRNYTYLQKHLDMKNRLSLPLNGQQVPMVYPYLTDNIGIVEKLITNRIYTANYWPNVLEWARPDSIEYSYAKKIIHLPIDQRINLDDLNKILNLIA